MTAEQGSEDTPMDRMTGFIVNQQKKKIDKLYKAGETIVDSIILDIDYEKKIVELSERLVGQEESKQANASKKAPGKTEFQKAVVELNKEQYLVVTLKSDRTKVGVCILHSLSADSTSLYQNYGIGDEIDVKVTSSKLNKDRDGLFVLTCPRPQKTQVTISGSMSGINNTLEEGEKVVGTLRSIKGMSAFIQVGSQGKVPIVGRLQKIETSQKNNEFD